MCVIILLWLVVVPSAVARLVRCRLCVRAQPFTRSLAALDNHLKNHGKSLDDFCLADAVTTLGDDLLKKGRSGRNRHGADGVDNWRPRARDWVADLVRMFVLFIFALC